MPDPANTPGKATPETAALVKRRSPEWAEHHRLWRWLSDSYEGGDRYRKAVYGVDARNMPVMNLVRHKREFPDPRDAASSAGYYGGIAPTDGAFGGQATYEAPTDDDFALRLARTPVPTFVAEAISDHLDRVFAREVKRTGPAPLVAWWADVDGKGTPVDAWMHRTVGPLLLACGQLDVLLDHPKPPDGEVVLTQADVDRLGLGRCIASYILPENLVWWRLLPSGRYAECLVREYAEDDRKPRFRHWTDTGSRLYDDSGAPLGPEVPHQFGRVPVVRLFAGRKLRCANVGQSPYEATAERQREYYNRDSELILSDTTQAHPLLQGPEDYVQADGSVPVGPSWLLPKKKNTNGAGATYEGFDYVDAPKGGAESIRTNKHDLRDDIDRDTAMNKPAGSAGQGIVSQSGISKGFDNERLNNKLSGLADVLAAAERALAEAALAVLGDGKPDAAASVTVEYSKMFDLTDVEDMGAFCGALLRIVGDPAAPSMPSITGAFLKAMVRQALPGREDATYSGWDAEIDAALADAAKQAEDARQAEMAATDGGMA